MVTFFLSLLIAFAILPVESLFTINVTAANYDYNSQSLYNWTLIIHLDIDPGKISWTITHNDTLSTIMDGNGNNVSEYTVITETALITDNCYLLTIHNSFGDGLRTTGGYWGW